MGALGIASLAADRWRSTALDSEPSTPDTPKADRLDLRAEVAVPANPDHVGDRMGASP